MIIERFSLANIKLIYEFLDPSFPFFKKIHHHVSD